MEFKVSELEREPIEFDLALANPVREDRCFHGDRPGCGNLLIHPSSSRRSIRSCLPCVHGQPGLSGCGSSGGTGSSTGSSQPVTSTITVTASADSLQHGTVLSMTVN